MTKELSTGDWVFGGVMLTALALVGVSTVAMFLKDKFSSEGFIELPYSDVVVDNALERTRANVQLNHLYGGVPDPTPNNFVKMITGTPPYLLWEPPVV